MTLSPRVRAQGLFLASAAAVNFASLAAAAAHPQVRPFAVLDMSLTVAGLYYWLVVRPGHRSWLSLGLVAYLGLLRASFAFPEVVPGREWILGGLECAFIAAAGWAWRRSQATSDPVARLRAIFGRVLATEFAVFYYAFAWRAKPQIPANASAFTLHRKSGFGDLLFFVGLASLLEIVPVHLVVGHWSRTAAWTLTGLSVYGAIWAVAVARSLELRPTLVAEHDITVRLGLLFELVIPRAAITTISSTPIEGARVLPKRGTPTVWITFDRELQATQVLGRTTPVRAIGLAVDEGEAFLQRTTGTS